MSKQLAKCPFCGGEIKLMFINENTYENAVWDESIGNVPTWIKCYGCDSEFFHDEPIDIPEKQIEWWNTRKPLERIIERLEEAKFPQKFGGKTEMMILRDKAIEIVKNEGEMNE